ncbi:MAG: penicillin-binding transpeptidase domain-containing protein [Saccharofermentanales bacterium]
MQKSRNNKIIEAQNNPSGNINGRSQDSVRKETARKETARKETTRKEAVRSSGRPHHGRQDEDRSVRHKNNLHLSTSDRHPSRHSHKDKEISSSRIKAGTWFAALTLLCFCAYIISNLFTMQIVDYKVHAQEAASYHYRKIIETPDRGSIYDTNGKELAFSSTVETIGVTPKDVRSRKDSKMSKEAIAEGIAAAIGLKAEDVLAKITDIDKTWILLKKRVEKNQADKLREFRLEYEIGGISFDPEDKRVYPENRLAGTILGFTNIEGDGQFGLELQYNDELRGNPGYTYTATDNYGKAMLPFAVPVSLRATDGNSLVTTIDIEIQKIVEKELASSVKNYNVSEGGIAIVMDPYTGSILAMANTPGFDPNNPMACPEGMDPEDWTVSGKEEAEYLTKHIWKNRAISDSYEPGSTFKAITAAMAMEEGKFKESEILNDIPIKVADRVISCNKKGGHGLETTSQAFWNSCNPIFVMLSQRIGISVFYNFVRAFGFIDPTGIDLPGEAKGIFHAAPAEIDMACLAFGEQSTITPIALITAYSAFANGGSLIKPRVVKSLVDSEGDIVREYAPEIVRQVVSEQTAARVRTLLEGVVMYGTGSKGYVGGYHVGGKTSTSTRLDGLNVISFLSMAPISQPQICIIVILFAPDKDNSHSSLAALTSAQMTEQILDYMGQPRVYTTDDIAAITKSYKLPDLKGLKYGEAADILSAINMQLEDPSGKMNENTVIGFQWPAKNTALHKGAIVSVYASGNPAINETIVPDIKGKNVTECISAMTESGINIIIDGKCLGVAVSQEFDPGTAIGSRSAMKVAFEDTNEFESD